MSAMNLREKLAADILRAKLSGEPIWEAKAADSALACFEEWLREESESYKKYAKDNFPEYSSAFRLAAMTASDLADSLAAMRRAGG